MNVNKTDINDKWETFLHLAKEAKMKNDGLRGTVLKNNPTNAIEKQLSQKENKKYIMLSNLSNVRYNFNNESNKNQSKILGTKFDAYA